MKKKFDSTTFLSTVVTAMGVIGTLGTLLSFKVQNDDRELLKEELKEELREELSNEDKEES